MKFSTLKKIEEILQKEIEGKERDIKSCNEILAPLYEKEDAGDLDETDKDELDFWRKAKSKDCSELTELRYVLEDFNNHDFR